MSQIETATVIIEAEARESIKNAKTVEDKFKAAFSIAKNHWMFTDEDIQYKAGVGAVLIGTDKESEQYKRIESELSMLKSLAAAMTGVSVNFPETDESIQPIDIQGIWKSVS